MVQGSVQQTVSLSPASLISDGVSQALKIGGHSFRIRVGVDYFRVMRIRLKATTIKSAVLCFAALSLSSCAGGRTPREHIADMPYAIV
jgi:hypothetical protein